MTTAPFRDGKRVIRRWNRAFSAVSTEPRRQLIVALLDAPADDTVLLPGSAMNPNDPRDLETLRRELRHTHLPMLADAGFVEWDTDPLVASRGPRFDEVAVIFEALHENATSLPDQLVSGCRRLERERRSQSSSAD
ncbi:hypothetical protein ACFOZ7_09995 [Natribaculum luteum]|uniref:ArsR family transcriptional regulator n=1 Tax=Natribaculum luteum TaxID=1586232 RepID=A0ABD5NZ21_9EURY|nr:hypothetical protein [Natribaculum luteum]